MENDFVKEITSKTEDFSQWYVDVILKTELADYSPVRGCMVIRPYGYALWENIQKLLDDRLKATGHKNAYFPLFIPESLLQKESEHVEGFAPEVAWVTHGGDEELAERLAVRPTSETIICNMYSKWIKSWRDLPVLINQWCNVVRWEKSTKPFLRTAEFLWQEGHTAHRTDTEAEEETLRILDIYQDLVEKDLSLPVIKGVKSESEKFAGALKTYTIEALMGDGRALQAGTSHNLGQHFAKAYDITYLDTDGQLKYVWQTSWGVTTRLIGAIVMVHGDDRGLKLPPVIAPIQAILVPILGKQKETVLAKADEILAQLKDDIRIEIDSRDEYTPGWKFNEWEMRGVPVRIEIGPKDIQKHQVVLVRRDTGEKYFVDESELLPRLKELLDDIQNNMFLQAKKFMDDNIRETDNFEEFREIIEAKRGFIKSHWCGSPDCEKHIKEQTGATLRCIPFSEELNTGKCIICGKESNTTAYFAKSY
ncbi:proline--tRNA ligase [Tepidanaerobacter syntrophicus]|uniref:Proline--tRNA ligase n=1 Tax=Tepidanaerobacter syntrophicus TaxID=224999 RepID=A0A0U9HHM9_9FIRM|nr:proline--tRNA ligase [Tepidanaerobacter syntrophicus]GAQ26218.1 prolyl-tRNA synthetase [Tepidanaerobacter syntrophicus]HHV83568.1 proline--tRNA ligase [Tepidanaerobacter syntrophicus]